MKLASIFFTASGIFKCVPSCYEERLLLGEEEFSEEGLEAVSYGRSGEAIANLLV